MVVMVGIDVHKGSHTAVVVDEVGRQLGQRTVRATDAGHRQLLRWALREWGESGLRFAVEDCRHVSARLERALLAAGQQVLRVPPKLMAGARSSARTRGKSDPIDALAIARAALREPNLPVATHDSISRQVKLLVDHREDLVNEGTRMQNRLRWHLHELDPALRVRARGLRSYCVIDRLGEHLATVTGLVARLARELLHRCRELTMQLNALWRELRDLVKRLAPTVLAIPGCGVLSAAMILGETAGVHRFRSRDAYARFTGTAPIPVWSGNTAGKVRLNRGGNRTLNSALHMIAITQSRGIGPGAIYLDKLTTSGKTRTEAIRLLRRRLSDAVYTALRADQRNHLPDSAAQPSTRPDTTLAEPTHPAA
jgi:transposase